MAVLLVLTFCIGACEGSSTLIYSWPWTLYTQLAAVMPLVLLAILGIGTGRIASANTLVLALPAAAVAVSVFNCEYAEFSVQAALFYWSGFCTAALIAAFLSNRALLTPAQWLRLPYIVGALLFLPIALSMIYWVRDRIISANTNGWAWVLETLEQVRNPHPFGHWNYTGGYVLLVLPWFVALIFTSKGKGKAFWLFCAATAIAVLLTTGSRAAILVVLLLIAVGVAIFVSQKRMWKFGVAMTVLGIGAAVVLVRAFPRFRQIPLIGNEASVVSEGDLQRMAMLKAGGLLFRESAWFGYGPGTTPLHYQGVRAQLDGGVEVAYQLHNAPLQVAVDIGALGIAALLVAICWCLRAAVLSAKSPAAESHGLQQNFRTASLVALGAYGVFCMSDYQLNVPTLVATLALHVGVVLHGTASAKLLGTAVGRLLGLIVFAGLVAIGPILLRDWSARRYFWEAWWTIPDHNHQAVLATLHKAAEASPKNPFYRTMLGLELARRAPAQGPENAGTLQMLAAQQLEISLRIAPHQEPCVSALGWLTLSSNPERAEGYFKQGIRLVPDRELLHLGGALSRIARSETDAAVEYLAWECLLNPRFVASKFWRDAPLRELNARTMARLKELWDELLRSPSTPEWRRAYIRYSRAWTEWWVSGKLPQPSDLVTAYQDQRAFFSFLAADELERQLLLSALPPPLEVLARCVQNPGQADQILAAPGANLPAIVVEETRKRLATNRNELVDLLKMAPIDQKLPLQQSRRLHHNVMFRNTDGPGLVDLAPRPDDAFFETYVSPLLPARGSVQASPAVQLRRLE